MNMMEGLKDLIHVGTQICTNMKGLNENWLDQKSANEVHLYWFTGKEDLQAVSYLLPVN